MASQALVTPGGLSGSLDQLDAASPAAAPVLLRGHSRQDSYGRRAVGLVRPTSMASKETIKRRRKTATDYENVVKKDAKIFEAMEVEKRPKVVV